MAPASANLAARRTRMAASSTTSGVRMFRFFEQLLPADEGGTTRISVSDVGKRIEVQGNRRAGGLIRTTMRASDILMDRVGQLENETFKDTPGFVFARITDIVEPHEDPTALHLEIQRQLPRIRTDLDRFSPLEISSLVQARLLRGPQSVPRKPELFGADLPINASLGSDSAGHGTPPPSRWLQPNGTAP